MSEHRLRILHLTDLHERGERESESWRRRRVLGSAWERNLDEIGHVDLVCFTGDLADRGQPGEYARTWEFLQASLQRLGVPDERLFIVPGNHDVDRGPNDDWPTWSERRAELLDVDRQILSRWLAGGSPPPRFTDAERDAWLARRDSYHAFLRDAGLPHLLPGAIHPLLGWRHMLQLPHLPFPLHLIGLDSAWLSADDHDESRLLLTEDQVMRLATDADGRSLTGLRLALMHHPLDSLADGAHCRRLLADHIDVLLRGHLHETEPSLWADPQRQLPQLASGCLYEGHGADAYPNACVVLELALDGDGRPHQAHLHLRGWSTRGHWFDDNSLYRDTSNGRLPWWGKAPPALPPIHPRVDDVFAGRDAELMQLHAALLPAAGAVRPVAVCALHGMPGVGKSYLVDRFYQQHQAAFPGGYVRLLLDPRGVADDAVARLLTLLDLPGGVEPLATARARLLAPRTLLHIENVDAEPLALAVACLVRGLAGCPIALSGRLGTLGTDAGWVRIALRPLMPDEALDQLRQELGTSAGHFKPTDLKTLSRALGYLPLALHLAAGHLRAGRSVAGFLGKLERSGYALPPIDAADPLLTADATRAALHSTFALSLELLEERLGDDATRLLPGLQTLGHAPPEGVGASLGAALTGLDADAFEELHVAAAALSLLDRDATEPDRYRLHPLLAQWLRHDTAEADAVARMAEWFCARLPALPVGNEDEQGRRWKEVQHETAALAYWLAKVPEADMARVERAGSRYAMYNGPFPLWQGFCERALQTSTRSDDERSNLLWTLANAAYDAGDLERALSAAHDKAALDAVRQDAHECALAHGKVADILQARGELDAALRIRREEELPVFERLGDVRSYAITQGQIADILQARGELDAALRIRREEQLPVYERLGDVREKAITQGKVADILQARGELDAALRIRREEELPVFERLGDVRSYAVTQGKIADILQARGELDAALRIRREEELPVFERLGDVRSYSVTQGKVADILQARGELDAALRIRREEELPVYERLGDVRSYAITQGKVADILQARGELDAALRIRREEQLPVYERLGDVRSYAVTQGKVADILQARGELDAALRIRREEELPVFERLGDVRSYAVTQGKIADILQARGELDAALRIRREEQLPVYERLGDVREKAITQGKVADILQARGELDAALRIRREEELPVFERLGDVRSYAVTQGKVADILQARGELDAALRIRREEELPVFERLGDVRSYAVTQGKVADILQARGELDAALRIRREEELPVFERLGDVRSYSVTQGKIADILQARGELDAALRIRREEELPVYERLGDVREKAITQGKVADILQARGELDAALRIRREEQLPVFERLGDVREKAITQGKVADILQARGELDAALRIRREEELPVFERLGDVRSYAVTQGKVADILQARGELDAALRIRREEELPVYERLGDVREKAITQGKVADILQARGELDEALRIHREEQLPVYERLGDVRSYAVAQGQIADILQARGELDAALRIRREEQLPVFERLGDVRSYAITQSKVADILQARGELDEALRIRREEELPVYERLGDVRAKAITQGKIADILQARGELDAALRIHREEELPVYERLGDVRSYAVAQGRIADILQARGEFDAALRIRHEEELSVYERLGDSRNLLVCRTNIAIVLLERGHPDDRDEAERLLRQALVMASTMRLPEAAQIAEILRKVGFAVAP